MKSIEITTYRKTKKKKPKSTTVKYCKTTSNKMYAEMYAENSEYPLSYLFHLFQQVLCTRTANNKIQKATARCYQSR